MVAGYKYHCIESTIDFDVSGLQVRLWINKDRVPLDHDSERRIMNKFFRWASEQSHQSINSVIDYLQKNVPNVNAIQVRLVGNPTFGTMVYTVPF